MAGGIPDAASQPKQGLLRAMERALAVPDDSPLVYGGPVGYEPLRAEIGKYFARDHAEIPGADHFILTNGAAGAIDMAATLLLDPGDVVISEMPTFAGSLRTFRGHGVEVVGAHLDDEGMRLDQVEAQIARLRADGRAPKLIYTIPTYHNPTGVTMSLQRRVDLVDLAAREGIHILEDTAYNELFFTPERPPTLSAVAGGRGVLLAGTFSKVIATGLRVGWLQAEPALINLLLPGRFDMGNSPLLHRMLHELHGERRLRAARRAHATASTPPSSTPSPARCATPVSPTSTSPTPEGGFFLWLRLRDGLRGRDVQLAGFEEGAIFPPGVGFYPGGDLDGDPEAVRLALLLDQRRRHRRRRRAHPRRLRPRRRRLTRPVLSPAPASGPFGPARRRSARAGTRRSFAITSCDSGSAGKAGKTCGISA